MAIADSMILQLLDPEAARRLQREEELKTMRTMAGSSPLLQQAYQTAGMLSSSLGSALGTDMRSPMVQRAERVKEAMASSGGNIVEAAKILQQSDPAAAMVLMQQGRAMQPKREIKQLRTGSTLQYAPGLSDVEKRLTKPSVVPTYETFQLEDGVITGRIDTATGRVIPISREEAAAIESNQAQANAAAQPKPDDTINGANIYLNAGIGTGVQQGAPTSNIPPEAQERINQQSGASRTARGQQPSLSQLIAEAGKGGARAPTVATMQGVPTRPNIMGQPIEPPAPSRTVQTSAEAGAEMKALQQADTKVLTKRLAELKAIPVMSADQQEEYRRIVAALADRAKINRASR
jgi:hypothetical protein